jgi:hypothetical protein
MFLPFFGQPQHLPGHSSLLVKAHEFRKLAITEGNAIPGLGVELDPESLQHYENRDNQMTPISKARFPLTTISSRR